MNKVIKYLAKKQYGDFSLFSFLILTTIVNSFSGGAWFVAVLVCAIIWGIINAVEEFINEQMEHKEM